MKEKKRMLFHKNNSLKVKKSLNKFYLLYLRMICMENRIVVSPFREAAAYEAIWCRENFKASFRKIAEAFSENSTSLPSSFVSEEELSVFMARLKQSFDKNIDYRAHIIVNNTFDYPEKLRDAKDPVELLYYTGNLDYLSTRLDKDIHFRRTTIS